MPSESNTQQILDNKQRYVPRGVATAPVVAARAEGSWVEDVDGRRYLDFIGGVGCINVGHRPSAVIDAIRDQADRYLHQCATITLYEPYVEVARRLSELSPCGGDEQRSALFNTGAEAVENAIKVARIATRRPGVIAFSNAFHGRSLLTMTMTANVGFKRGFSGPFAPEVWRATAPDPYRGIGTEEALESLDWLFKAEVDPETVACVVLEPVQGEGGFIPMPSDFPRRLLEVCREHGILYVDDEVQAGMGRTGMPWAIEHYDVAPDILVSGKSLGGGLPLSAITGSAEIMDAPPPGALGGTFSGNPLSCAAALVVLDQIADPEFGERSRQVGETLTRSLRELADRVPEIGDVRGLGPMVGLEFVKDREGKEPDPELTLKVIDRARDLGLLLLDAGLNYNAIRLLVPLTISDDDLEEGLARLEQAVLDSVAD